MVLGTLSMFCDLLTSSGRPEMLALLQITSRCCGTLTVQQCTWAPKALHEVSTRFCKSYGAALRKGTKFHAEFHEGSTRTVCEVRRAQVGRCAVGARLHRRRPIGPDCAVGPRSGPDSVGPIAPSGPDRGRTQSGRVNCTKLAWPSFAGNKKPALS